MAKITDYQSENQALDLWKSRKFKMPYPHFPVNNA